MAEMLLLPDHEIKLNQLYPMYYMVKQNYITLQECLEHIAIQCKAEKGNLALLQTFYHFLNLIKTRVVSKNQINVVFERILQKIK